MNERQDEGNVGWVNTDVAAEALGITSRSVRNYILSGELVARKETEGIRERYLVSTDSLHALRDRRKHQGKLPRNVRRISSRPEGSAELVRETAVDMLRETIASLETHIAQNAELRARLELGKRAESALREELEGERRRRRAEVERQRSEHIEAQERAEEESVRLEAECRRAEEEAQRLREELRAERSKGFWRRLFGG